jgi:Putative beta barrel porin-7 (BBP7)
MRTRLTASFLLLLTGAGWGFAQAPPPANLTPAPGPGPACCPSDAGASFCAAGGQDDCRKPHFWAGGEYLLWWVKDGPLPFPLVTTGDPASPNPGTLGLGGVPILTGRGVDYGTLSGVRVTAGAWLDPDGGLGVEGSGFWLPRRTKTFAAASDAHGNPVLTFRYLDPPDPDTGIAEEDAFQASLPPGNGAGVGPFAGGLAVISRIELWGAEANAVIGLADNERLSLQALVGFRYVDLYETLGLAWRSTAVDDAVVTFLGNPFPAPSTVTTFDSFKARNQFYGSQVGLRGEFSRGKFVVGATGKVALGENHESLSVQGSSTLFPNVGPPVTVGAGQFAAPSNIGRVTHDEFAVVPEVEVKVGYQATSWLRAYVGYDFLYWSRVVRPGNQVDLIVNDQFNPVNGAFGVPVAGNFPRREFNRSDFWAQGVTFGLEFRY